MLRILWQGLRVSQTLLFFVGHTYRGTHCQPFGFFSCAQSSIMQVEVICRLMYEIAATAI